MAAVGEAPEANNAGRDVERVTISEAATLLNVHPNTVRNRVKAEIYRAEKVVTERGPTWMIDRDSLTTNTPPNDSQQLVGRVPAEALTMLAREIVRESGLQRDPQTEARRDGLKTYVDALKHFGTLSGAAAVGVAALHKSLDLAVVGTVVSLVTLGLSFVIALAGVVFLTSFLADWDRFVSQKSVRFGYWVTLASGVLLFAGVLGFMLNAWAWDLR
jgi:hypothetical protein